MSLALCVRGIHQWRGALMFSLNYTWTNAITLIWRWLLKYDIASAPYHVGDIFDDFDDIFWFNHTLMKIVIDHHAPPKYKRTVKRQVPFINLQLRKACHRKSMLRNKYSKCGRTQLLWEQYRMRRNLVTKLKVESMADYFSQRCSAPWWRHQMETFSELLAICAWNSPVPGEFPAQRPVTRSFDVFFDFLPNKRLSKQS